MVVSNALELYTVYLGWREYDVIWQACIQFGLAWLPFLGLFYENLTVPFESEFGNGTETSFRRVFIELLLMCLVIMFCVYPWVPLSFDEVTYKPYCSHGAVTSTVGNSGTTYDDIFQSMMEGDVKVPGLYRLVTDWASGFTNALIAGTIPCSTNISNVMHNVITSRLTPNVQQQVSDFNNICYLKARAMFDSQQPNPSTYQSTLKAYGTADLNWMGSHVLQQLYYPSLYAEEPVNGFSYTQFPSATVDDAVQKGEMQQPQWGYPSCEQWWTDPEHGLQSRIVNEVNQQTPQNSHLGELPPSDQVSEWLSKLHLNIGSSVTPNDVIARGILYDSDGNYGGFTTSNAAINTDSGISGAMAKSFLEIGQTISEFTETPFKRDALSNILPIIQAIALFFVVLFMPLIQIFGRYRLGVCVSLSFILLALIFLNYIWEILNYLEVALQNSTVDPTNGAVSGQRPILTNFMTALYFATPLLFLSIMSIAGIKIGSSVNSLFADGNSFANSAANTGQGVMKIITSLAGKL